jgi:hypothetical protein
MERSALTGGISARAGATALCFIVEHPPARTSNTSNVLDKPYSLMQIPPPVG